MNNVLFNYNKYWLYVIQTNKILLRDALEQLKIMKK